MKTLFLSVALVCLVSACGDSQQGETSEAKPRQADIVPDTPQLTEEPESSEKTLSLEHWVAKLPQNDPRRLRYQKQIESLWSERDIKVENKVEEAEDSLESLQQRLSDEQDDEKKADLQSQIGSKYLASRNFKDAAKLYLAAIETYQSLGLEAKTAKSTMNLGMVYSQWRNFAKAEIYYTQALDYLEKTHGPEHPETIKARQNAMTSKSINAKVQRILEGQKKKEGSQQ